MNQKLRMKKTKMKSWSMQKTYKNQKSKKNTVTKRKEIINLWCFKTIKKDSNN